MNDLKMIQDIIDDVFGNKRDPYRLTRDFLKQPDEADKRTNRLRKNLSDKIQEKNACSSVWIAAIKILDEIDELEWLVKSSEKDYADTVTKVNNVINKVKDEKQAAVLRLRYIDVVTDWNEIAAKAGVLTQSDISKSEAMRIHKSALPSVKAILDKLRRCERA